MKITQAGIGTATSNRAISNRAIRNSANSQNTIGHGTLNGKTYYHSNTKLKRNNTNCVELNGLVNVSRLEALRKNIDTLNLEFSDLLHIYCTQLTSIEISALVPFISLLQDLHLKYHLVLNCEQNSYLHHLIESLDIDRWLEIQLVREEPSLVGSAIDNRPS